MTLHFAKVLENSAKIRRLELPFKTARNIRVENDLSYDILGVKGLPSIRSYNDSIEIKPGQIVSMNGQGFAKLLNIQKEPAIVFIFSY